MLNLTAALAPVSCLLGLLLLMDSFKLVPMRFVFQALGGGWWNRWEATIMPPD